MRKAAARAYVWRRIYSAAMVTDMQLGAHGPAAQETIRDAHAEALRSLYVTRCLDDLAAAIDNYFHPDGGDAA